MSDRPGEVPALRWTTLLLCLGAAVACWPLWPSLVLAAWTAALLRPLQRRLERWMRGRRGTAEVLSLLVFLLLAAPVALLAIAVVSGAQDLAQAVAGSTSAKAALESLAAGGSTAAPSPLPWTRRGLLLLAQRYGADSLGLLSNIAGAAATGLVAVFLYFAGAFAFLVDKGEGWGWVKQHAPLRPAHLDRLAAAFHETGRGLLVGVGLTTAMQGVVATAVYGALGVSRWWVLGPITGVASVIPLVGSALVWGPIAIGLWMAGHPVRAAIAAGLGVAVISTADNLLRPIFARMGALKMPMFLLFVAIFGGMAAFGAWGALLGPLVVRLAMEALAMRRELEGSAHSEWIPPPAIQAGPGTAARSVQHVAPNDAHGVKENE